MRWMKMLRRRSRAALLAQRRKARGRRAERSTRFVSHRENPVGFEPLEPRVLLAADIAFSIVGGTFNDLGGTIEVPADGTLTIEARLTAPDTIQGISLSFADANPALMMGNFVPGVAWDDLADPDRDVFLDAPNDPGVAFRSTTPLVAPNNVLLGTFNVTIPDDAAGPNLGLTPSSIFNGIRGTAYYARYINGLEADVTEQGVLPGVGRIINTSGVWFDVDGDGTYDNPNDFFEVDTGGISAAGGQPDVDYVNVKSFTYTYNTDTNSVVVSDPSDVAQTPGADGIILAPDGEHLVVGGQRPDASGDESPTMTDRAPAIHYVNINTGAFTTVDLSGLITGSFHVTLDPSGLGVWTARQPGPQMAFVPFTDLEAGTNTNVQVINIGGDETEVTQVGFAPGLTALGNNQAYYTNADPVGDEGFFGIIDLDTGDTTRIEIAGASAAPGLHSIFYDEYSGNIFTYGATFIRQIDISDPLNPVQIDSLDLDAQFATTVDTNEFLTVAGLVQGEIIPIQLFQQQIDAQTRLARIDQGLADNNGLIIGALNSGSAVFVDIRDEATGNSNRMLSDGIIHFDSNPNGANSTFVDAFFDDTSPVEGANVFRGTDILDNVGGSVTIDTFGDVTLDPVEGATIGDFVWSDLNGNGIQDMGEPGVEGATVNLLNQAGDMTLATTTTDANGNYEFVVLPGTYRIGFEVPAGFAGFSPSDQGGDEAVDSDADTMTGQTGAFAVAATDEVLTVDAGLLPPQLDFGDAPDSYGTTLANDGARHDPTGVMLGAARDAENDGIPTVDADGDDTDASDDEDGVTFVGNLVAGQQNAVVMVNVAGTVGLGVLDAWIDFNADGTFDGANERIFDGVPVIPGSNPIPFDIPADALTGKTLYSRFRVSSAGVDAPTGASPDGEVEDHALVLLAPNGPGEFTETGAINGSNTQNVVLADVNGDGHLDIIEANLNDPSVVHLNDGAGGFSGNGQDLGTTTARTFAVGDIDGDNDLDLVQANGNSEANRVLTNNGAGVFTDSGQTLGSQSATGVALGDVDGDGDLDIIFGNVGGIADEVWLNDGAGVFTDSGQTLSAQHTGSVALGDIDHDGDLDLVVGNYGAADSVWLNNGAGVFTDTGQMLGATGTPRSYEMALGDIDGDCDLDLVVAVNLGENRVYINDGTGTLIDSGQLLGADTDRSRGGKLADVDGDGDLDFVEGVNNAQNRVWFNDGAGTFTESTQLIGSSRDTEGIAVGDVNGDGSIDFVSADTSGRIYLNQVGPPTGDITDVMPDPRATPVDELTVVFDRAVIGFDFTDLTLTNSVTGNVILTGANDPATADNITWTIPNLAPLTGDDGTYTLTITAAGSGIMANGGPEMEQDVVEMFTVDTSAPIVTDIFTSADTGVDGGDRISNDTTPVFDVQFNKAVVFTANEVSIMGPMGAIDPADYAVSGSGTNNLRITVTTPLAFDGVHNIRLDMAIEDLVGNTLVGSEFFDYTLDATLPLVGFDDIADRTGALNSLNIFFDEPVFGFDVSDLTLTRDGGGDLLTGGESLFTNDNQTYLLSDLAGLTGDEGTYTIALDPTGSGITDVAGNVMTDMDQESWTLDTVAPVATFQDIPDFTQTIGSIDIGFDETPVGLTINDFTLNGQDMGPLGATLVPLGGNDFRINFNGTVDTEDAYTVTLLGSSVTDAAGNAVLSVSESFTVDNTGPIVPNGGTSPAPGSTTGSTVSQVTITFEDDNPLDATTAEDPANFRIVGAGMDETFDTGDDIDWLTGNVANISYDPGTMTTTIDLINPIDPTVMPGGGIEADDIRIFAIGSTSIEDAAGNKLNDGMGDTFSQFRVNLGNVAPVAVDDEYDTFQQTALAVDVPGVLGNDTDEDMDTLMTTSIVDGPSNGMLQLVSDGSFGYSPNPAFFGTDSFDYTVSDGDFEDTGTVTINVLTNLDVDANGTAEALADTIMIIRRLVNFSGDPLIGGALGAGAIRTDAGEIASFIDAAETQFLDVDDNGEVDALTDGVLILRHLVNFTGDTLIDGALGVNAMRTDPVAIGQYINNFLPMDLVTVPVEPEPQQEALIIESSEPEAVAIEEESAPVTGGESGPRLFDLFDLLERRSNASVLPDFRVPDHVKALFADVEDRLSSRNLPAFDVVDLLGLLD